MFFVKKNKTDEKLLLEEITKLLFPPLELYTDKDNVSYQIDYSVDTNIESVITDLEDGYNDETARKTLKKITERLNQVRKLLLVEQKIHKNVQYVIVDDGTNSQEDA